MSSRDPRPKLFGPSTLRVNTTLVALALFAAVFTGLYLLEGWTLWTMGAACMCAAGLLAVFELLRVRVRLEDDALVVVGLFATRRIAKDSIEDVTWQKSAGVSVRTADGWVRLPAVGKGSPQGMVNTIRAWLRR